MYPIMTLYQLTPGMYYTTAIIDVRHIIFRRRLLVSVGTFGTSSNISVYFITENGSSDLYEHAVVVDKSNQPA